MLANIVMALFIFWLWFRIVNFLLDLLIPKRRIAKRLMRMYHDEELIKEEINNS